MPQPCRRRSSALPRSSLWTYGTRASCNARLRAIVAREDTMPPVRGSGLGMLR